MLKNNNQQFFVATKSIYPEDVKMVLDELNESDPRTIFLTDDEINDVLYAVQDNLDVLDYTIRLLITEEILKIQKDKEMAK